MTESTCAFTGDDRIFDLQVSVFEKPYSLSYFYKGTGLVSIKLEWGHT